jgi:hypothetical protein
MNYGGILTNISTNLDSSNAPLDESLSQSYLSLSQKKTSGKSFAVHMVSKVVVSLTYQVTLCRDIQMSKDMPSK